MEILSIIYILLYCTILYHIVIYCIILYHFVLVFSPSTLMFHKDQDNKSIQVGKSAISYR